MEENINVIAVTKNGYQIGIDYDSDTLYVYEWTQWNKLDAITVDEAIEYCENLS